MKTAEHDRAFPALPLDAAAIVNTVMRQDRRVMLYGPMGVGKSTFAALLARALAEHRRPCCCLSADPGTPAFGLPGALSVADWQAGHWRVTAQAALCTLDAGRFRLPLVAAARQLAQPLAGATVLIDAPGVVRGVAGRELLQGLVEATAAEVILALLAPDRSPPLSDELRRLPVEVFVVPVAGAARRPGKRVRGRQRTAQWEAGLRQARPQSLELDRFSLTGTPPLPDETSAWPGKQIALLRADRTLAMGEVLGIDAGLLTVMIPDGTHSQADTLLIRDAMRNPDGFLETARPYAPERFTYLPPNDVLPSVEVSNGPRLVGRVGAVDVALVNGVFGDPLLHLRLRHQKRSMLLDLGDGSRLPARIAHQVSDVFISHAHMDHIGGFLWLLRSRIGDYPACRLYGPPGLARHIAGFLRGILWDRVENNAPGFEILELHGDCLQRFYLRAGNEQPQVLEERGLDSGVLLAEAGFRIRAVALDHHGTPVLAYAFEAEQQLNIRKDRLRSSGFDAGPWLSELKQHLLAGSTDASIRMPDGHEVSAGALADELVLTTPGKTLVYATDLGDTPDNRQRLIELARHAHTLFCECAYLEADADYADMNGHLTTRACGEIATAAGVNRLVPFHFSRRYLRNPELLYDELNQYCARLCHPVSMALFEAGPAEEPVTGID